MATTTTGSSIIIWFRHPRTEEPVLLTGKESKYLTDLCVEGSAFEEKFGDLIRGYESFNPVEHPGINAKIYFSKNALKLEGILGLDTIQFDTPTPIKNSDVYKVKYRFLPKDHKRGIIKGGKEGSETPLETILREVREELGINLIEAKIVDIGECAKYKVFSIDITSDKANYFLQRIDERRTAKSGEVFDLKFKPLSEINTLQRGGQFNAKSDCAINLFKQSLGGKAPPSASGRGGKKTKQVRKKKPFRKTRTHSKRRPTKTRRYRRN
jgi:8-oxo-dGTP pyrophosphatase MutT (NUDIX family)